MNMLWVGVEWVAHAPRLSAPTAGDRVGGYNRFSISVGAEIAGAEKSARARERQIAKRAHKPVILQPGDD
jgi:hypothetical protein